MEEYANQKRHPASARMSAMKIDDTATASLSFMVDQDLVLTDLYERHSWLESNECTPNANRRASISRGDDYGTT